MKCMIVARNVGNRRRTRSRCVLRAISLLVIVVGSLPAQSTPEEEHLATAFKQLGQLVNNGQLKEAEALLREVMPSPRSEPKKKPGELQISLYGLSWGLLASAYLARDDYQNAERMLSERINVAEQTLGSDHMGVAVFLNPLAGTYVKEGKYEMAIPLFRRSLDIHRAAGLDNPIVAGVVYTGLAEALLATGKPEEAVALLKPVSEDSRFGIRESVSNMYAVALRETGKAGEASRVEEQVKRHSYYRTGVNEQERDFIRARLLSSRGSSKAAESVYRNWIQHWEEWGQKVSANPAEREWDRILMEPLSAYVHFLTSQGRHEDADKIRVRLRGIRNKYGIRFAQ